MTVKLRDRIKAANSEDLRILLRFFDEPPLREHYTGLISDIKWELAARAAIDRAGKK